MFKKGHKLSGSRKGIPNKEDLNSLRKLLEESFSKDRLVVKSMLSTMLTSTEKMVNKITEDMEKEKDPIHSATLCRARTNMLEDFKWLMNLKASLEPKQVEMPQPRGGIILIRSEKENGKEKPIDVEILKDGRSESGLQTKALAG